MATNEHSTAGSVGEIVNNIRADIRQIVGDEITLAKKEIVPSVKSAGIGAGLLAGAAIFAGTAAQLLLVTAALAIYTAGLPIWAGFLIIGGGLLVIAALIGLIGYVLVRKAKKPTETIQEAQHTVTAIKGAIARGTASAKSPQIESH